VSRRRTIGVGLISAVVALLLLWWLRASLAPPAVHSPARTASRIPRTAGEVEAWRLDEASPIQLNRGASAQDTTAIAGSLRGHVLSSATGQGIGGAELSFEFARGATSIRTGSEGAFRFEPSEIGTYRLASVTADGFLPFAPEWGRSPITFNARAGERIEEVVLMLSPAVEYVGVVLDPDDKPVGSAEVRLLNAAEGVTALAPLPDRFTSDDRGEFRFRAPEGAWLEANHPSFSPGRAYLGRYALASRRLEIHLSALRPSVELESIAGRVLDPQGTPIEGASVSVRSRGRRRQGRFHPDVRSNPDGQFQITDLWPGEYDLKASYPGYAPARADSTPSGSSSVVLKLSLGSRLSGTVRDAATRAPVAAFTLSLQRVYGPLSRDAFNSVAFMDGQGKYEISGLPPGNYAAIVAGYGYSPSAEAIFTNEEGPSDQVIDFDLKKGAELFGRVVDRKSGAALAGAQVYLEGQLSSASVISLLSSTVTDSAGRFELRGLGDGLRSVMVSAEGHHTRIVSGLEFENGQRLGPVELDLTPTAEGEEPTLELTGIGAVLMARNDVLVISELMPGAGAAQAGLVVGDEILSIDGRSVLELGFNGAVQHIRGPEGTCVPMTIRRAADRSLITITVCRQRVRG
jgi:hypothetical protein